MTKIKSVIIDDDAFLREELKDLVKTSFSQELEIIGDFEHPLEAIPFIQRTHPELLFADIQMPGMNGFEMLDHLDTSTFEVIFITSFNQYAIQAIRYSALDYLLKPISVQDLSTALQRYKQRTDKILTQSKLANLKQNLAANDAHEFQLIIPTKQGDHQFAEKDIMFCLADSNYTHIHLAGGKKFLASKTLSDIESMLPESKFIRIHKSHLVNLQHVLRVTANDEVELSDHTSLLISRRRLAEVRQVIKNKAQSS